jgi:hypothetical protein
LNLRFQKENLENLSKNKMCNFIWDVKDNDPLPKIDYHKRKKYNLCIELYNEPK